MLERIWNQGAGLYWRGASHTLRVLPVVPSQDCADATALWMACAHLQQQGYPVVVLDATVQESAATPGLQDLLQPRQGFASNALAVQTKDTSKVATLPAARGLVQLQHKAAVTGQQPLDLLHRYVCNHAVVVLWAPADMMTGMMQGSTQSVIQLVASQTSHLLSSYRALKTIFMASGQMPRLVAMRPAGYGLDPVLQSLAQCAIRHLHAEPSMEQLDPQQPRQLQRWALQCLAKAPVVKAPHMEKQAPLGPFTPAAAWSH